MIDRQIRLMSFGLKRPGGSWGISEEKDHVGL